MAPGVFLWEDCLPEYNLSGQVRSNPFLSGYSDAAEYKMWGNGIALPCVYFILCGIVWYANNVDK